MSSIFREKEPFRVYIMIPLMPGFEGNVGAPGGSALQAVLHWTYMSLSRGPNSLFERLKPVSSSPCAFFVFHPKFLIFSFHFSF